MKEENKTISLQCKVTPSIAKKFEDIANEYGFGSKYNLLLYLVLTFVKYVDMGEDVTDDDKALREFAKIFEGWQDVENRILTTKPTYNRAVKLTDSVNIFSELGRSGYIVKHITFRGSEERISNNVNEALNVVMKKLHPKLAASLSAIGDEIGEQHYIRIIEYLMKSGQLKTDKEIATMFNKNDGSITYGNVPVKRRKRSIER